MMVLVKEMPWLFIILFAFNVSALTVLLEHGWFKAAIFQVLGIIWLILDEYYSDAQKVGVKSRL